MEGFQVRIWEGLKHRLEKGVETATHKSQQMVEISRLNLRIRGKKEDINRLYRRLGILAFEAWNKDMADRLVLSTEMKEILQSIRQIQADISAMEQDLLLVRGKIDCPACGAVFDRGAEKCPVCNTPTRADVTLSPEEHITEVKPQASEVEPQAPSDSSHQRQSESFSSHTESPADNNGDKEKGDNRTNDRPDSRRALSEFQTVTGEAIFICPECGNQLKELVNTCPFCGEKFL
jgi:rubrerythrin